MTHQAMADREFSRNAGYENQDQAWICSNRDVWYANPFYSGPAVPHPEDDDEAWYGLGQGGRGLNSHERASNEEPTK